MKRVPQLDAVRGIAVLVVLFHNTDKERVFGVLSHLGWMGVDLFFVLSGLLITGVLLDTKGKEGYFRNFYARRCLRIWPLYYAVLLFMFVVVPLVRPSEAHQVFDSRAMPWWSYLVFIQNFLVPSITNATGPLGVTWSLAVEEQFYLVWPLLVYFCSTERLRKVAIVVVCLSPLLRLFLAARGIDIYANTFCRLDGLMAGALLAMFVRSSAKKFDTYVPVAWCALLLGLPLAIVAEGYHARWIVFSLAALAFTSFVYLALFAQQRWVRLILTNRFLVYSGLISYGIYLLEKIPADMAKSLHLRWHPLAIFLAASVATYCLATLSWFFMEKPCMGLKRFFEVNSSKEASSVNVLAEVS